MMYWIGSSTEWNLLPFSIAFVGSTLIAFICTGLSIRWSRKHGWVDLPNPRSLHCIPTPRIGGIGIVIAFCVSLLGMEAYWHSQISELIVNGRSQWLIVGAALSLALAGLYDDLRHLRTGMKFTCEFIAGVAVLAAGISFAPFSFVPSILAISVSYLITMLWLTGFCNVFNFMDGINGLSGGTGVIYGFALFLLSLQHGRNSVALFSLLLGGGCLGFVFLNFPSARTFMGDTGSLYLGFFFALLVVRLAQLGTNVTALVLVVSVFVFDSGFTLLRRLGMGENIFKAHRSHLYQRLVQAGVSQPRVTLLYLLLQGMTAVLALSYESASDGQRIGILLAGCILLLLLPPAVSWIERRAARPPELLPKMLEEHSNRGRWPVASRQ
jgi:UDP-GlcNAc:undecaprenyl-phosphate/decaprenyl-phosphate GlcNAc-1-phosphate transferase